MTIVTQDADGTIRQDGQTADEWLADLFEYEVCGECGLDADRHEVVSSPLGHFFARCLDPIPDDENAETELAARIERSTGPR